MIGVLDETNPSFDDGEIAPPLKITTALTVVAVVSAVVALLQLCLPIFSLQIFSRIIPAGQAAPLLILLAFVSVLICFQATLDCGRAVILTRLGVRIALKASSMALQAPTIEQRTALISDGDIVSGLLASRLARSMFDLPWTAAFIVGMYELAPVLGWMTLAALAVIYAASLLSGLYKRRIADSAAIQASMSSRAMHSWELTSSYAAAVGLWMGQWSHLSRIRNRSRVLSAGALESQSKIHCGRDGLRQLIQGLLMGITAFLVIQGALDVGVVVASGILFARALAPHEQVVANLSPILSAWAACRRLRAWAPSRAAGSAVHPSLLNAVGLTVRAASVTVIGLDGKVVLDEIDFAVRGGQIVAITGDEGCGKTALLRILSGEIVATAGEVTWNDYPIAQIGLHERSAILGVLEDKCELGNGTVAQVISGHRTVDFQDIVSASDLADCHSQIVRLPAGYQTDIGYGGLTSSLRKRIAFARAVLGKPRLICLDSPTAGISPIGEEGLAAALCSLRRAGCAIAVATHSIPIMRVADRVIDLRDGCIGGTYAPAQVASVLARRSNIFEEKLVR